MSRPSSPTPSETSALPVDSTKSTIVDEEAVTPPEEQPPPPRYSVYTTWEKRFIVLGASLAAFFSPFTAQIYLPALTVLANEFKVSDSDMNLTLTTYMIFQGIVPMFIGSLADQSGRRPAYVICFVVYIAANIGLALSQNYASLLVVRCIQSAGSSSTVALASAVVADSITSAERGQYVGLTVVPIVLAPALGPVLGGVLAEYLGWRSIFWFLTILAGVFFIILLLFFPETCRRIVDDGSVRPPRLYRTGFQLIKDYYRAKKGNGAPVTRQTTGASNTAKPTLKFKLNPFESLRLLFERELGLLLGFSAIVFAGFYAIAASMPTQIQGIYGFDSLKVGLMYLPMAGGSVVAAFLVGPLINWNYRRHCKHLGIPYDKSRQQDLTGFPIEKARLEIGLPLLYLSSVLLLVWGWALHLRAPVAVPCVLLFLFGVGMIGFNNTTNTLIIDIHPGKAGTATAANNFTRCLLGAAATAAIIPMINGMGVGWAFTLLALLYIVFSPALLAIMYWGVKWRQNAKNKELEKKQKSAG
ncbi:major facilitator superfamily transporter [Colletotrichum orchidophilum]|uniref:Major facilitator superfamily transporter n=1 Tax=Colletotrichum orchidophilum TaxID=1209926 RepID=A0A1G4ANM5_9PEZI|nr:major facilitator superfamily transporter [Colletotrichum orchidophilum]OHE90790.1 major facilitator superfamily transporter [Colletotrichum orchidophilum]